MSVLVRNGAAYLDAVAIFVKRAGAYAVASGLYAKRAGVYVLSSSGLPSDAPSLRITASQIVKGSAGRLDSISCIAGSGITLTVYDNPWAASGTILYSGTLSAGQSATLSPSPLRCIDGFYASFSGTATFDFAIGE